jgi:AraC-like DNA-binding protein
VGATVLPVASRALLHACRALGVDSAALLARAGVAPDRLEDPDARLPAEAADAIWREAFAATGDALLALHAAEATPPGAFRVLDYLGATGPTLGDGLRRIAAYFPLVDPRGAIAVEERGDRVALAFRGAGGAPLPPPAQEYTLAVLAGRARAATTAPWTPREVRFAFPAPADPREHARVFGVVPSFGCAGAALVLPRAAWDLPTVSRDPGLFTALDAHARALVADAPGARAADALPAQVAAAVASIPPGRAPSLEVVARGLGTSRRSLQRGLERAGTTFARLADQVRRERAQTLLAARDVSIAEVSWLLGFSEQSAFARAFRRWTGRSPTAARRSRAAAR